VSAQITSCTVQGGGVYGCTLQVTLNAPLIINTVLSVGISGATYSNPSGIDMPAVVSSPGCVNPPLPSPYLLVGNAYTRFDVNISTGGCAAGAVITFAEAVAGALGARITQTVTVPGLGSASASAVLPAAPPTPTPTPTSPPGPGRSSTTRAGAPPNAMPRVPAPPPPTQGPPRPPTLTPVPTSRSR
jgi:hypothetical protein